MKTSLMATCKGTRLRTCTDRHPNGVCIPIERRSGTLWDYREFVADETAFVIAYADKLTDIDLAKMIDFHHQFSSMGGVLTMGLMHAPAPRACGIVTMDEQGRITRFVAKPEYPQSDLDLKFKMACLNDNMPTATGRPNNQHTGNQRMRTTSAAQSPITHIVRRS